MQGWLKIKMLLFVGVLGTISASAGAAPADALVVETVLLNALTSSPLVETYHQTAEIKGTILFRVGTASPRMTSGSILLDDQAPFTGFSAEAQQAFREAAEDVMRRVKMGDELTTPSFSDARIRVYAEVEPVAKKFRRERPQVFGVLPPGYSASGEYALVQVGTTWSGNMHGMKVLFYLQRTANGWVVLGRGEIRYL